MRVSDRPGLLVRLSHIIVVQVLFVFAALALILFYPDQHSEPGLDLTDARTRFQRVADGITEILDEAHLSAEGLPAKDLRRRLEQHLADEPSLVNAVLYIGSDSGFQVLHSYSGSSPSLNVACDGIKGVASDDWPLSGAPVPAGDAFTPLHIGCDDLECCYRFSGADGQALVLVASMTHGLVVSSKSNLKYALLLLFLFSALVSLLTVYLLSQRFRGPLKRLIRGMEKTTEGELYYLLEIEGDAELNRVVTAFNTMTRTLWDDQQRMKEYTRQLHDTWLAQLESLAFLATLIDRSPCCILAVSPDGEIVLINRKAATVFGYETEEVLGRSVRELFVPAGDGPAVPSEGTDDETRCEVVCRRHDGSQFPAYLVVSPIGSGEGTKTVQLFILLDISESKGFRDMMIQLDRYYTRGEMAGDIAHEINNYLAVLSGNIELIPLFLRKGQQEKVTTKLDLMKATVDKIVRFTDGLLDSDHTDPVFQLADLNQLIQNMLAFLMPQNRFDGIEIRTELASDLPLAEVDVGQMQQLFINLLQNASDASGESAARKTIWVKTRFVDSDEGQVVRVEVKDSGPGVPAERVSTLFQERFTTKRKGRGYGLLTCSRIVEVHRGQIGYERQGEVTCFAFELPTRRVSVAEGTHTDHSPAAAPQV